MENIWKEAKKRIKTSLVFGAIARQENLQVEEEDFSNLVMDLAESQGMDEKQVMRQLGNNYAAAQMLSDQALSQKIVDLLLSRATFNVVPESSALDENTAAADAVNEATAITGEEVDIIETEE